MLAFLVLVAVVAAFAIGYAIGRTSTRPAAAASAPHAESAPVASPSAPRAIAPPASPSDAGLGEHARLIRSFEAEAHLLRRALASRDAALAQLGDLAAERRQLFGDVAQAHAETARYRQLVVDLENNAPPPWFGPGAPDDLKLIVGVGPVLERMLYQLGVTTFRQIARWSEHDIDEFDAKLPEFPGRIRRDAWVTQARALHQSKYGEVLPVRGRD